MNFPSLLFTKVRRRGDVELSVFNDLRIDLMLPQTAIEVMSGICPPDDIPLRAEVFSSMEDCDLRQSIARLYAVIDSARALQDSYDEVGDRALRDVLFTRTAERLSVFCAEAAKLDCNSFFIKRMAGFFSDICAKDSFKSFAKEATLLTEKLGLLTDFTVTVQDDLYGTEKSEKPDICSRLKNCADELGIPLSLPEPLEYRACDEFTSALVSQHGELCALASEFREKYEKTTDPRIFDYVSELDFYLSICSLTDRVKKAGIPLCRASITENAGISFTNAYDITLLEKGETNIVPNDASLRGSEKFFFLGGANGGGKTTFLRTLGVNTLLAISGAPVAALSAEIGHIDGVFTHFPHDEHFEGEGRFDNEKRRVARMLDSLGKHPLVLLNETYSTTNEEKSIESTSALADLLYRRGVYGIYVTHAHDAKADGVSRLIVAVDESDSNRRTYKVVRAVSENRSFAEDILKKYGLSAAQLYEKFPVKEATE